MGNNNFPKQNTLYCQKATWKQVVLLWIGTCKIHQWGDEHSNNYSILWLTLCHRRMRHAHQQVIKNLADNTKGGPDMVTEAPSKICKGCEKGKSKWLPSPSSKSRANKPLDLVHSDLDEFPVCSISGYKWTATYHDNHSSYGVMFYLKSKDEEFTAFKAYQAWAKRQTSTTLKCKWTDQGGAFLSNEQKQYLKDLTCHSKMDEQKGSNKP